jgi:hypothetical protein
MVLVALWARHGLPERPKKIARIDLQYPAKDGELKHVQAPLHAFDPADERLILTIRLGQIPLDLAGFPPPRDQ